VPPSSWRRGPGLRELAAELDGGTAALEVLPSSGVFR